MSNPLESLNREVQEERQLASLEINKDSVVQMRGRLENPYRWNHKAAMLTQDGLAELLGLLGAAGKRTVSHWESGTRGIPIEYKVTLHRMDRVITALAQPNKKESYLYLVTPQPSFLIGQQVSPMELLGMPSPVGFRMVMASLPSRSNI